MTDGGNSASSFEWKETVLQLYIESGWQPYFVICKVMEAALFHTHFELFFSDGGYSIF